MSPYEQTRKRVLKRLFVGLTLFILSFFTLGLASIFFTNAMAEWGEAAPFIWVFITTVFVTLLYQPISHSYSWLFKHFIFPRRSHALSSLHRLIQELAQTSDLSELSNLLVNTVAEVLQLKTVSLLLKAPHGEGYTVASASGWRVADYRKLRFLPGASVLELIKAAGPQILLREKVMRSLSWQEANQITKDFDELHATCVIPLWVKSELVGSLNLLAASPEQHLTEGDLRFFRDFSQSIAPSVRNALVIGQLKMANEELRDSQSQLLQSAKLTAIEQLASGIAHEIHNPLTIISGKAQVLLLQKERKVLDEKVEEVLKTIVSQTRRAADITKKLLMFSKASTSPREKIRLEGILEDTLSLIAYQTSLEGTQMERLVAEDLPDFWGNVQELREVFLNLILNALQATGPGGKIQIGLTFDKADNLFVIQVADNGPGILPENLDKVFNPFFTTRPEGVGLGLFLTQQIVHRYGGSIRVESQPKEGTLFVIELPLENPSASNSSATSETATDAEFSLKTKEEWL